MSEVRSAGHLNPGSDSVVFDRFDIGLPDLVRHVWAVRWTLPPGTVKPQRVLTYPSFNVVFYPESVLLHGPERRAVTQELSGSSWVVGILCRPAAAALLTTTPLTELIGAHEPVAGAPMRAIADAMRDPASARDTTTEILRTWLAPLDDAVTDAGRLVNRACRIAEERDDIIRTADLALELNVSTRSLERLIKDHTGFTPKWLIECRRMQKAATTLFAEPSTSLADLAAGLGFADHAHFTRRYREIIGETPEQTRSAVRPSPSH